MKKKIKVVLSVILIMIAALIFIDWYTAEPRVNSHAKKLLSEKYNEEFEVLDTWGLGGKLYSAECYPKRDRTILFEGTFKLDDSEFMDGYDQAIISKKIRELMQPKFNELFQECYVHPFISGESGITDQKEITIESFVKATESTHIYFMIGVNQDLYIKSEYQEEYKCITQYLNEISEIDKEPTIHIYFLHNAAYRKYVEYFKDNVELHGDFNDLVNACPDVGFGFKNGKPNINEEEYMRRREE